MKAPVLQEGTEKELWWDKAEHTLLAGLCSAELFLWKLSRKDQVILSVITNGNSLTGDSRAKKQSSLTGICS